jgi:hypothetical protein
LIHSRASAKEFASAYAKTAFHVLIAGAEAQVGVAVEARTLCPGLRKVVGLDRGLETNTYDGFVFGEDQVVSAEKANAEAILAPAVSDERAVVISSYDENGEEVLVVWSHRAVARAALRFASITGLRRSDQLVTFLPVAWFGDFLQFSTALVQGALVSSAENSTTVLQDLPRLAPDVLLAPMVFYRKMYARVEADVRHSSGLVSWLHSLSNAFKASGRRRRFGRFADTGIEWFLSLTFRSPLKCVTGLGRIRLALGAEGNLPPELATFFRAIDVDFLAIDLDPRFGAVLDLFGCYEVRDAWTAQALEDFKRLTNKTFARPDCLDIGSLEVGRVATGEPRAGCEPRVSGKISASGEIVLSDDIDVDDVAADTRDILRRHVTRLNSSLLVKHSVIRRDTESGWVAIIDADIEFLRTVSSDAGAEYEELLADGKVVAAVRRVLRESNTLEVTHRDARIDSFTFFAAPLSATAGLTRNGSLRHREIAQLAPLTRLGPETEHLIIRPLYRVGVD